MQKKVLEKIEPNQEKGKAIYEIFNRVWNDVMSRRLYYLKVENMGEIIASYTYHTTLNILRNSNYTKDAYKYPETHKAGMEAVRSWLKWVYNEILTEDLFDSLIKLEDVMQKEKLVETKVHEVLEGVMKVQEIVEDPIFEM
jgi:hypothetical protein